jgi:hypothetical protein
MYVTKGFVQKFRGMLRVDVTPITIPVPLSSILNLA